MTRTHAQHLDEKELEILRDAWVKDMRPSMAAGLVHCSPRIAQKHYSYFRAQYGNDTGYTRFTQKQVKAESRNYQDASFYGPVKHREVPPPNCIPSLTKQRLMAGR